MRVISAPFGTCVGGMCRLRGAEESRALEMGNCSLCISTCHSMGVSSTDSGVEPSSETSMLICNIYINNSTRNLMRNLTHESFNDMQLFFIDYKLFMYFLKFFNYLLCIFWHNLVISCFKTIWGPIGHHKSMAFLASKHNHSLSNYKRRQLNKNDLYY